MIYREVLSNLEASCLRCLKNAISVKKILRNRAAKVLLEAVEVKSQLCSFFYWLLLRFPLD